MSAALNQVCFRTIDKPNPASLETYRSLGGYEVLKRIITEQTPADEIISESSVASTAK